MEHYQFGTYTNPQRGFLSKEVTVYLNGNSQYCIDIKMRENTTIKDLTDEIIRKLKMKDVKKFRLFDPDGIELFEGDEELIKPNTTLYASHGEDFNQSSKFSEYQILRELGKGGYGQVMLAIHKRTKQNVAIKIVNTKRYGSAKDVDKIFAEAEMLKALSHKHIVKFLNCYNLSNMDFVFVMEYLEGGELGAYVKEKGFLSEEETKYFFKQLVSAIYFCHNQKLIHRDLKLENILLENKSNKVIKIVDFGIAGLVSTMDIDPTEAGSLRYIAPEVWSKKNRAPSPALDIWAMGCILYAMITGKPAFVGKTRKDITDNIKEGNYALEPELLQRVSPEFVDLLQKMLTVDFKKRITIPDIMAHPWITGEKPIIPLKDPEEETKLQDKVTPIQLAESLSPAKKRFNERLSITRPTFSSKNGRTASQGNSPVDIRKRAKTFANVDIASPLKKDALFQPSKKSSFSTKGDP